MMRTIVTAFASAIALLAGCSTPPATDTMRQVLYLTCSNGRALLVYEIDPATGRLTETQRVPLGGRGGPIAISDDQSRLYAAVGRDDKSSTVSLFTLDAGTGAVSGDAADDGGSSAEASGGFPAYPTYIDVDAGGRYLLAAYYGPGLVTAHAIKSGGAVGDLVQTVKLEPNAHAIRLDPAERFAYVPATGPNKVWQFRYDAAGWSPGAGLANPPLRANAPFVVEAGESARGKQGPRHYAYHPTLDAVYFVNELDSSVTHYALDREAGTLTAAGSWSTLPEGFEGKNTCADIHVTPDGRYVYASNRGHDSIARYAVDAGEDAGASGALRFLGTTATEKTPREFCLDVTGRYLYAAGQASGRLAAYRIDPATGDLALIETYVTPEGPIWVEAVLP